MSWSFSFQGLLRDFSSCLPPQYRQRRSPRIGRRYLVDLIDQLAQFGRRVVAGDAPVLVTQQDLPVFLRHAGGTKPATERVLQVMHADRRKTRWCCSVEALLRQRASAAATREAFDTPFLGASSSRRPACSGSMKRFSRVRLIVGRDSTGQSRRRTKVLADRVRVQRLARRAIRLRLECR